MRKDAPLKKRILADIVLIAVLLLVCAALFVWRDSVKEDGAAAVVYVNGEAVRSYPLDEDAEEKIDLGNGEYNVLVIKDGAASVTEATCPDKVCVRTRDARYDGETIICLPHKLVVKIEGGESSGVDV